MAATASQSSEFGRHVAREGTGVKPYPAERGSSSPQLPPLRSIFHLSCQSCCRKFHGTRAVGLRRARWAASDQKKLEALLHEHLIRFNRRAFCMTRRKQKPSPESPVDPSLCFMMCMYSSGVRQTPGLVLCLQAAV